MPWRNMQQRLAVTIEFMLQSTMLTIVQTREWVQKGMREDAVRDPMSERSLFNPLALVKCV